MGEPKQWKAVRKRCTKILCNTDSGESIEFEVCIKNGKLTKCKKL